MDQPDLMKDLEAKINENLKDEGVPTITILYGNEIYPKTYIRNTSTIKIYSVWINDENKPVPQLWLV